MTPETSDDARPPGYHNFKEQKFSMKNLSKNTFFIQKKKNIMLVTDVVTGKYIEEAQPLKLQPA